MAVQSDDDPEPAERPADPPPPDRWLNRATLTRRGALLGMAAVGGVAAVDVGVFAYAAGWLTPSELTPAKVTDRFEQLYGVHDGFRRNHAKGVSASGSFASNGAGAEVCRAAVFARGTVPVIGRFSMGGTLPDAPDKPDTVRGLGLAFLLANGQQWRTAMINLPVFPDSTVQGFYERMLASKPVPATGQPDPAAMATFMKRHPETAAAMKIIKASPPSDGFADSTFNSLNAFHFTNASGSTVPVRWSLIPPQGVPPAAPAPRASTRNSLFDALIEAASHGTLSWSLILTVGEPGDPTTDATEPWPTSRRTIDTGTVTIDQLQTEAPGNARDVNFDPTVLPDGIAMSDDPLLSARSAVYARSFNRRAAEPKSPSAVNVTQVLDGR